MICPMTPFSRSSKTFTLKVLRFFISSTAYTYFRCRNQSTAPRSRAAALHRPARACAAPNGDLRPLGFQVASSQDAQGLVVNGTSRRAFVSSENPLFFLATFGMLTLVVGV